MNPFNVFEAICADFKDMPSQCTSWLKEKKLGTPHMDQVVQKKGIKRSRFIKIILALLCCNAAIILFYRKRLNTEIKSEMK